MTDRVDTDALRGTARKAGTAIAAVALNGGRIQMRVPADADSDTDLLIAALECDALAAADEVDRLRAVIENAPHAGWCRTSYPHTYPNANCNCWKAVAS